MAGTPITGNETSPTDRRGSYIVAELGETGTPITGNETAPATRRGSWIILEQRKRAHRHIGLVRGARGVG